MPASPQIPELLRSLWLDFAFEPNTEQRESILHADGPLFLPAGPGSGKTRVLLWRTINLITHHNVKPEDIFLSTFTEKAAFQLKNGLRTLLTAASEKNGKPYDSAKLYVGTVHSLCQRLLLDRRISANRSRSKAPVLLDGLDQYMFVRRNKNWEAILAAAGISVTDILSIFNDSGTSRHKAITHLLGFFNRLSEEMIDPATVKKGGLDSTLRCLLQGYSEYRSLLQKSGPAGHTDLSLLQTAAINHLKNSTNSHSVFRHVIVDEYQDTNPVQENIFFHLAKGHKNICVVGDDDQALYRFRGATVENFVEFPERCATHLNASPNRIVLGTNYRSREDIVNFYNRFIVHNSCDWSKKPKGAYRLMDKKITPHRTGNGPAVFASAPDKPERVAREVAVLVKRLLDEKKVADPNQIAFLFPSLKSAHVTRLREALENVGLNVYAPRAGQFLNVAEARSVFGLLFQILGSFEHRHTQFNDWMSAVKAEAANLMADDSFLKNFVKLKRAEAAEVISDYTALSKVLDKKGWKPQDAYDPSAMPAVLASAPGLSDRAKRAIKSGLFARFAGERIRTGKPFTVRYAVTRATSLDWNVLDIFYQLSGFRCFKAMFDLAENGKDEGPVCNLSLISQYLSRYLDHYSFPISGEGLQNDRFLQGFGNYLYVLFRRGESEYEDADDPFPKGRIPFITVHQSKGLEFPVVVLANPRKDPKLQQIEEMVAPLLTRKGEPLGRMPNFDVMRMFYVALSRAKNLLVLTHFKGQGQRLYEPFADMISTGVPKLSNLKMSDVPAAKLDDQELPQSYSYTGDFLLYRKCPRQYMFFRKYGFVPSRSQTMFFGSLVHQTLEDLHQHLINLRKQV